MPIQAALGPLAAQDLTASATREQEPPNRCDRRWLLRDFSVVVAGSAVGEARECFLALTEHFREPRDFDFAEVVMNPSLGIPNDVPARIGMFRPKSQLVAVGAPLLLVQPSMFYHVPIGRFVDGRS